MRTSCLIALFLTCGALAFGQLDSNTVTIQASRYCEPDARSSRFLRFSERRSEHELRSGCSGIVEFGDYGSKFRRVTSGSRQSISSAMVVHVSGAAKQNKSDDRIADGTAAVDRTEQQWPDAIVPGARNPSLSRVDSIAGVRSQRSRRGRTGAGPKYGGGRWARRRADRRDFRWKFSHSSANLCRKAGGFFDWKLDQSHELVKSHTIRLLPRNQVQAAPLSVTSSQSDKLTFP